MIQNVYVDLSLTSMNMSIGAGIMNASNSTNQMTLNASSLQMNGVNASSVLEPTNITFYKNASATLLSHQGITIDGVNTSWSKITSGSLGTNGATGATGPAGTNGATGATGPAGTNGATGATGPSGTNGTNGATGPSGTIGTSVSLTTISATSSTTAMTLGSNLTTGSVTIGSSNSTNKIGNWNTFYNINGSNNYNCLSTETGGSGLYNYALFQNNSFTGVNSDGYIVFNIKNSEKMRVAANGYVGIGTSTARCPLEIAGKPLTGTSGGKYFSVYSVLSNWNGGNLATSVYAEGCFLTSDAFVTSSDSRIKTNIVDIEDDTALTLFRRLQPKTYQFKDVVQKGSTSVYGFIAQDVKTVLPHAVKVTTNYVPNIYELSQVTGDLLTLDATLLEYDASGILFPNLKIIQKNDSEIETDSFVKILGIVDSNTVQLDQTLPCEQVFIYGQEVNNFHTLEKDAIWTVATAALQEVDRQLQAEKLTTASLQQEIQTLQTNYASLLARIVALESK